jgi:hypothetical protein
LGDDSGVTGIKILVPQKTKIPENKAFNLKLTRKTVKGRKIKENKLPNIFPPWGISPINFLSR